MSNKDCVSVLLVSASEKLDADFVDALRQAPSVSVLEQLAYRFCTQSATTVLSAWPDQDSDHDSGQVCLSAQNAHLNDRFEAQSLNRLVARQMMNAQINVLVLVGFDSAVVDLARVGQLMGVKVIWFADQLPQSASLEPRTLLWLADAMRAADQLVFADAKRENIDPEIAYVQAPVDQWLSIALMFFDQCVSELKAHGVRSFDYTVYEFCLRDHPLLCKIQQPDVAHFAQCERVLDLGCGAGIFLDLLAQSGVNAHGVERCEPIAEYGRGMGLDIITDDALDYLARQHATVDGIYCSHFVEHLPFEAVARLIHDVAAALQPGGIAVFTFPDPESIRSQLLGFWRDPEHVRYYHPQLIETIAMTEGLVLDWSSYDDQPHQVPSFSVHPPELPEMASLTLDQQPFSQQPKRWFERIVNRFGLLTKRQLWAERVAQQQQFADFVEQQQRWNQAMAERSEKLWAVNQTWAWNDNVTLRFVKRG